MSHAQPSVVNAPGNLYCAFHKHANSKVQKPQSQLCFLLPSIIITITSNTPWNTETHKTDWNHDLLNLLKLFPNRSVKMIDGRKKRNVKNCQKCRIEWNFVKSWLLESITLWATLLNYGKCSLPIVATRFKIYDQIYLQHLQVNMAPVGLCHENLAELQQ